MKKIKINTQYEARLDSYISDELNGKFSRNQVKNLIKDEANVLEKLKRKSVMTLLKKNGWKWLESKKKK